jgi:hypothetical protein
VRCPAPDDADPGHRLDEAPVRPATHCSRRQCAPYGVQDRSVPASSVASIDSSTGQRICDETDVAVEPNAALAPVAPTPEFPVLWLLPPAMTLGVATPIVLPVATPTALLVLCVTLLTPAELVVALVAALVSGEFVAFVSEAVLADETALLPASALVDGLEEVPAAPAPTPAFVVVPVICAGAGVARTADRIRTIVRKRMAINQCWCRCQRRPAAQAVGTDPPNRHWTRR